MNEGGYRAFKHTQLCTMKKIIVIALLLAACQNNSRRYVNHTDGQYSVADDTLIIQDTAVINRTGYQKIRNGQLLPKQYQVKQWACTARTRRLSALTTRTLFGITPFMF